MKTFRLSDHLRRSITEKMYELRFRDALTALEEVTISLRYQLYMSCINQQEGLYEKLLTVPSDFLLMTYTPVIENAPFNRISPVRDAQLPYKVPVPQNEILECKDEKLLQIYDSLIGDIAKIRDKHRKFRDAILERLSNYTTYNAALNKLPPDLKYLFKGASRSVMQNMCDDALLEALISDDFQSIQLKTQTRFKLPTWLGQPTHV